MYSFHSFAPALLGCWLALAGHADAQDAQPGWKGKSGPYTIEWTGLGIKATRTGAKQPVFDAMADAIATWATFDKNANGVLIHAEFTYRLLSVAGPYLSYEEGIYCDCGGAHPTSMKRFHAIDLDHSKSGAAAPVSLTAVFPEGAVFSSLIKDSVVAKALGTRRKPSSLADLIDALQDTPVKVKNCEYEFGEDLLSSFAFYDVKEGNVAVRLSLSSAVEACRGQAIQLGLSLPLPESRKGLFSEGLLMVDAEKKGRATVSSFKFSKTKK